MSSGQVTEFPGPNPRQAEQQKQRKLPVIARLQKCLFLLSVEANDGPSLVDRDLLDFQGPKRIVRIGRQVTAFGGVVEKGPAA
jgi:hypothetical protein